MAESTSKFVGRRLRRFALIAAGLNLILCLMFLVVAARTNSTRLCNMVEVNIRSYTEPLSRELVIGNRDNVRMILETLENSELLKNVSLIEIDAPFRALQDGSCRHNGVDIEFMTPVTFGQRQIGLLKGSVVWITTAQVLVFLGVAILFSLIFMSLSTSLLLNDLHTVLITPIRKLARGELLNDSKLTSDVLKIKYDLEESHKNAKYAAIAQLTQMLAHDVRKPFSMIQIVLQNISAARTMNEVRECISMGSREVNCALANVTRMLSSVMQAGRDHERPRELVSPKSLVQASIHELCRLYPGSNIAFSTSFKHIYLLEVDSVEVQRVFSNIVENAVQAMQGQGEIWFKTAPPDDNGFIELTIGNSNGDIEPEVVEKVFDAFFTKGKKGGTGLGLAIVKKIIDAHAGKVGCRVLDNRCVEFWFTLPVSKQIDPVDMALPDSTVEVDKSIYASSGHSESAAMLALSTTFDQMKNGVIAIVDDCQFTCSAWIQRNPGRPLITFESPETFWQHVEKHPNFFKSLMLIITDRFFGNKSAITGLEFAKLINGKPIFLASASDFPTDAVLEGIAGILPTKVMEWEELLTFCVGQLFAIRRTDATVVEERKLEIDEISPFQTNLKAKFLAYALDIVNEINIAVDQKNAPQVVALVHKLQGSAAIVGANLVVNACRKLYSSELPAKQCILMLKEAIATMEQELRSRDVI